MKTKIYLLNLGVAAFVCFGVNSYADFGSRHKDDYLNRGMKVGPVSGSVNDVKNKGKEKISTEVPERKNVKKREELKPFDFLDVVSLLSEHNDGAIEQTLGMHIDQEYLESLSSSEAFDVAFEEGDELFEINYNALDGVGINVGNGKRFSRQPRLDLKGPMAWANVMPHRITGPNGDSCVGCHRLPFADGAGLASDNTVRIDPERKQSGTIERQTPHMFGMGSQQLLAEEITTQLQSLRDAAVTSACSSNQTQTINLIAKTVDYGHIDVSCDSIDYTDLDGVDSTLVVKPFEWKGLTASVRDFVRGASHQELGMQAVELVGDVDADFDGVSGEFTVGDITALAVYAAAQPRPTTKLELNTIVDQLSEEVTEMYGLPLNDSDIASIQNGEKVFNDVQCSSCHVPSMIIESPVFYEPSRHSDYSDDVFPAGESVRMPEVAIQFDLTKDMPNNPELLASGQTLGQFERDASGGAIVRLYGDLKRHDMGPALAEEFDEGRVGSSVFLTETLWGVGATKPYLHDGRATTLLEAIAYHGGDSSESKDAFINASINDQRDLLAFLDNLVLLLD